jgi:hypothetical protein
MCYNILHPFGGIVWITQSLIRCVTPHIFSPKTVITGSHSRCRPIISIPPVLSSVPRRGWCISTMYKCTTLIDEGVGSSSSSCSRRPPSINSLLSIGTRWDCSIRTNGLSCASFHGGRAHFSRSRVVPTRNQGVSLVHYFKDLACSFSPCAC